MTGDQILFFALLGSIGWLSYLAFYGALAAGPISLVSPIASCYAAVTVVLAVVIVGERISTAETAAVLITISGAMLASSDLRETAAAALKRRATGGAGLSICAMVLFGGYVFGVSYYSGIGWLAPIFLARGFTALSSFSLMRGVAGRCGGLTCPRALLPPSRSLPRLTPADTSSSTLVYGTLTPPSLRQHQRRMPSSRS